MKSQPGTETMSLREALATAEAQLAAPGSPRTVTARPDARRLVEEACGHDGSELWAHLDRAITVGEKRRLDALVARRRLGEPLQYVVGRWGFRTLDLMVDQRVLIPRPETEQVVGWALERLGVCRPPGGTPPLVVDLGTGSGAIGLSVAAERSDAVVVCTDRSADALGVARANLAGLGLIASRVTMLEGSWFEALPDELRGRIDLVVSNPPYVTTDEELPDEVAAWEPTEALRAGGEGMADLAHLVRHSVDWLAPSGVLVLECAPDQGSRLAELAMTRFAEVEVREDLAGRPRAVVATGPRSTG